MRYAHVVYVNWNRIIWNWWFSWWCLINTNIQTQNSMHWTHTHKCFDESCALLFPVYIEILSLIFHAIINDVVNTYLINNYQCVNVKSNNYIFQHVVSPLMHIRKLMSEKMYLWNWRKEWFADTFISFDIYKYTYKLTWMYDVL